MLDLLFAFAIWMPPIAIELKKNTKPKIIVILVNGLLVKALFAKKEL